MLSAILVLVFFCLEKEVGWWFEFQRKFECVLCSVFVFVGYVRDILASDVPVFVLLQKLAALGWRPGSVPEVHSVDSAKVFGVNDFVRRRCYLQCLLTFDTLRQRGLEGLRSDQHPFYYQRLLQAASPGQLPCNLPALEYKRPTSQLIPALPSTAVAPMEDGGDDSESSAHVTGGVGSIGPVPKSMLRIQTTDSTALGLGDEAANQVSASEPSSGSTSSSSSSSSSAPSSDSPQVVGVFLPETSVGLNVEEHLTPGEVGHYRRFCMQCPERHRHPECRKKRNVGTNQTANFGQREPEAFLLAWAAAAPRFATRAEHVRFIPSAAEVREQFRRICAGVDG